MTTEMTLNRYLADSGICSRRKAVDLIKAGLILVNNTPIDNPGYRVQPKDSVKYKNKLVSPRRKIYILLNKPKGYISSVSDPDNDKSVVKMVKNIIKDRVYPVGRLDVETTGLLILTNDGDFAQQLAHPKYEICKIYHVILDKPLLEADMKEIHAGVKLSDGLVPVDRIFFIAKKPKTFVGIEIHSGKNRVVRRIFAKFGYHVQQLERVGYANLSIKGLPLASWRFLLDKEIKQLSKEPVEK